MKAYTFEESLNRALGQKGEPLRDEYENEMKSFLIGESIRKARQAKELTQEQLGELMGVKRAQVCRIEKGRNLSLTTIARAFKAMGINATFDMGKFGKVALW